MRILNLKNLIPLTLALIFAFPFALAAQEATDEPTAEATSEAAAPTVSELSIFDDFYNHASGWHVRIPEGWTDESTAEYARFTREGDAITVLHATATEANAAIDAALAVALPNVDLGDPALTNVVNLLNGEWTQHLFTNTSAGNVAVYAQVFENVSYAVVSVSEDSLPVIIAAENTEADTLTNTLQIAAALYDPTIGAQAVDVTTLNTTPVYTVSTYENEAGETVTSLSRARTATLYVVTGATTDVDALFQDSVLFSMLSDFFITPQTAFYLYLGVGLSFAILLILIASMYVRYRNLRQDEASLRELENE